MKILRKIYALTAIAALFTIGGCADDEEDDVVLLPSKLVVSVTNDANTEGLVHLNAEASNANYYVFTIYDKEKTINKESGTGIDSYQFTESSDYRIRIRAHARHDKFVETTTTVSVVFRTPGNGGNHPTTGYTTPLTYPNYTLTWNDEFDGDSLSVANWNYEIGTGDNGWGNNELQYYLKENTSVADGILTIDAKEQFFNNQLYTSSRLTTQNKQSFQYGRIDIRAAMPFGQGLWPALWMLGDNFSTAGWPFCGEIDIMEMVGGATTSDRGDAITHGTAHWDNNGYASFTGNRKISAGTLADEFHVYSIVWDSQKIEWFIDDVSYHSLDITPAGLSEFHQKFFFILNVAVGGNWPGSPDSGTTFPQSMYVDYVRVFQ